MENKIISGPRPRKSRNPIPKYVPPSTIVKVEIQPKVVVKPIPRKRVIVNTIPAPISRKAPFFVILDDKTKEKINIINSRSAPIRTKTVASIPIAKPILPISDFRVLEGEINQKSFVKNNIYTLIDGRRKLNLQWFYDQIIMKTVENKVTSNNVVRNYSTLRFTTEDKSEFNSKIKNEFRVVPLTSFAIFSDKINKIMDGNIVNSDDTNYNAVFANHLWTLSEDWFMLTFLLKAPVAGGYSSKVTYKTDNIHFMLFESKQLEDNNCLIRCMKMLNPLNKEKAISIRKKCGIAHNNDISLEELILIEDYMDLKVNVYDENAKMLYESKNEFSTITGNIMIQNQHAFVISAFRTVLPPKPAKQEGSNYKTSFLFWDLETVFDKNDSCILKPYCLTYMVVDEEKIAKQCTIDDVKISVGFNCMQEMVNMIRIFPRDRKLKIVSYNGSRFDNFFLASSLADSDIKITQILYSGNSILGLQMQRHSVFDLCRFTLSSLKAACDGFNTLNKKVDGFSHLLPQMAFESGKFDEYLTTNGTQLEIYAKMDVLAMFDLFVKVRSSVDQLTSKKIENFMTIGHLAFDHFKGSIDYCKMFPDVTKTRISIEECNELMGSSCSEMSVCESIDLFKRRAVYAGKCHAPLGRMQLRDEKIACIDAFSLYPSAMHNSDNKFPIGHPLFTKTHVQNKCGIYRCNIISQPKVTVIPNRDLQNDGILDWGHSKPLYNVTITSVDLELILNNGGNVEIQCGIYWDEQSADVFRQYLQPFVAEKQIQDTLKNDKNASYNASLRNMCKLFMNSLSGKVIQRNFSNSCDVINSYESYTKSLESLESDSVEILSQGVLSFISGIRKVKFNPKNAKPSHLGVFIYSYARKLMYNSVWRDYDVLYSDTDSAVMRFGEFERIKLDKPELFDTLGFGKFVQELDKSMTNLIITDHKKIYTIFSNDLKKHKSCAKGIRANDIYFTEKQWQQKYQSVEVTDSEIESVTRNSKRTVIRSDGCVNIELYQALYDRETIHLLTSGLQKEMNFSRGGGFRIKQIYSEKIISYTK